jgi:hypothetical protein
MKHNKGPVAFIKRLEEEDIFHELVHLYHLSLPHGFSREWYVEVGVKRVKGSTWDDISLCHQFGTFSRYSADQERFDGTKWAKHVSRNNKKYNYEPDEVISLGGWEIMCFYEGKPFNPREELSNLFDRLSPAIFNLEGVIKYVPLMHGESHVTYPSNKGSGLFDLICEDVAESTLKTMTAHNEPSNNNNYFTISQLMTHPLSMRRLELLFQNGFLKEEVYSNLSSREWLTPFFEQGKLPRYYG